jgi:hypothetical protein
LETSLDELSTVNDGLFGKRKNRFELQAEKFAVNVPAYPACLAINVGISPGCNAPAGLKVTVNGGGVLELMPPHPLAAKASTDSDDVATTRKERKTELFTDIYFSNNSEEKPKLHIR